MHLERLALILEIVGQKDEATVADICAHSDLPKPSAYRLVQDLVAAGLLEPVAKGRFVIGTRLKRIMQSDQSDRVLLEFVAPALKRAAAEYGAAFFLSRLRGRAVEIIHVEPPDNGVSYLHPGLGKRPLHACSCSKAVAAFSPELRLTQDLEGRLKGYTEFTLTRIVDLEEELKAIRKRGYAECVEEIERGMCSVAAPLGKTGPGATMSIGTTGSTRVFTPAFRETTGKMLTHLACDLSASLGWPEPAVAWKSG
ncbi:IclR family transcriptional regulator [Maritimibacter sp. 55A14]|uniref:IclR family transcriptional regulator n=1 Tax=Maritimibacter sp. 55A14 TaxID=2174844 RepID=UPI000D6079B3|nr:IclR family transcriptional regulator [Maritimibacter sp. 55A14]PWE28774.1 IclR family transcriptional regulator [Maritimibacter sp. 55A14]